METYEDNSKWIMPPGLLENALYFETVFNSIFNSSPENITAPIIIYGPRGSGKTLFTNIFEKLYRTKHPEIKDEQIVRLNIAPLPQHLMESELFGYVPGAFTGANPKGKKGLVEEAKGGILFLDEIGELTKPEQAKLLTFIEDRVYYKVGDTKPQKWAKDRDIQIICTTNREPDQLDENGQRFFREDFVDRFECFPLVPIHQRRGDVLYHLFEKAPEIVQSLLHYQVLSLLAYNWPGNVREIERVGRGIRLLNDIPGRTPSESIFGVLPFLLSTMTRTSLILFKSRLLEADLRAEGIAVQTLGRELNKYGLGISTPYKGIPAFKKRQLEATKNEEVEKRFGVRCYKIEAFEKARDGFFNFYCPLFRQYAHEDKDLADVSQWDSDYNMPASIKENHKDLADKIDRFLHLNELADAISKAPGSENIFDMTIEELERHYFKGLLDLNHGKIKAVAKKAGFPESTCRDRLKRLGLTSKTPNK